MRLQYLLCLAPLALTGCVGFNTALFMTKSNAGLDFDMKPPTVEINISRKEGVVEPSFEGGKTPPVMASFSTKNGAAGGLHRFFFGVDQTFSGGDAAVTMAKLYDSSEVPDDSLVFDSGVTLSKAPDYNSAAKKGAFGWKKFLFGLQEAGEVRPFFFGTDSQLGVKVAWNGVGGVYPDTVKIGYNRKEIAVAPVSFNPREIGTNGLPRTNVVRVPSFLATVDSDVAASTGVEVSWMQYFATGDAATLLARQPGVRKAMAERADRLSSEKSEAGKLEGRRESAKSLAADVETQVNRLTKPAQLEEGARAAYAAKLWKSKSPEDEVKQIEDFKKLETAEQKRLLIATAQRRMSEADLLKISAYLEKLKSIK
jgi:hypothetical protein